MAAITSNNSASRTRHDMTGQVADYLGVTFSFVAGQPTLRLQMKADDGRNWVLRLSGDETAQLFARCDEVRRLAPVS